MQRPGLEEPSSSSSAKTGPIAARCRLPYTAFLMRRKVSMWPLRKPDVRAASNGPALSATLHSWEA